MEPPPAAAPAVAVVVVSGAIGVGKSTVLARLEAMGYACFPELFVRSHAGLLRRFYRAPDAHALHLQLVVLLDCAQRLLAAHDLADAAAARGYKKGFVFVERSPRDGDLFARLGLAPDELATYRRVVAAVTAGRARPDMRVHLSCSLEAMLHRVRDRARPAEQHIDPDYLGRVRAEHEREYTLATASSPDCLCYSVATDGTGPAEATAAVLAACLLSTGAAAGHCGADPPRTPQKPTR